MPAFDNVIVVTIPAVIEETPTAVVPNPTACKVLPIVTVGAEIYPEPPSDIEIEEIVPSPETIAVAAADVLDS